MNPRAVPKSISSAALLVCILVMLVLTLSSPARATNQITGGCSSSSSGITLPNYDLVGKGQQTGTGTVVVQCTGTGSNTVKVALTAGTGSCTTRTMRNGANSLGYNIYTTSAFSTVWCDPTTRVSVTFNFSSPTVPQTLSQNVTMFAKVPSGQSVPIGSYSDTPGTLVFWTGGNSATSSFTVAESAPATCSASTANLSFGTYTGAASTAQANVTVTCTSATGYTIALSSGSNYSGTTRRMKSSSGQFIGYALYHDAAFTSAWGDGTTAGTTASGTGTGAAQSFTVHGRAPAGPLPTPGSYSDAVVVTVSY